MAENVDLSSPLNRQVFKHLLFVDSEILLKRSSMFRRGLLWSFVEILETAWGIEFYISPNLLNVQRQRQLWLQTKSAIDREKLREFYSIHPRLLVRHIKEVTDQLHQ